MILLDFVVAKICVYFQYLFMHLSMCQCFWRNCFNLRFKINVVVMISFVIIINFVLTLQVSSASLSHDLKRCEIKVVFNHTCSLHTCVCAGSRSRRVRLSGFRQKGIASQLGVSQVTLSRPGSVPNNCSIFILKVSVMCTMFSVLSSFVGPDPDTNPEKIDSVYRSIKIIPDPGSSGSEMILK